MRRFKLPNVVPPGQRYFFHVEETDTRFEHPVLETLLEELRRHYVANNLPLPMKLREEVVDYICRHVPEKFCVGTSDKPSARVVTPQRIRSFTETVSGVKTARRRGQDPFVPPAESERRATICSGCRFNDMSVCKTCDGLKGFARKLLGLNKKTSRDEGLGVCYYCGCMVSVKVHIKREILDKSQRSVEYPAHCWLKQEPVK